ncbi:luciferase-type oxidoreductase, BA3436 family [Tenacibaculum sp. MAR_2009_124]|uniref:LLM class oxidoreductase n=1 Tax=Tenacibaculum sp. MAR_2009_124 TaxID=1250059 RepID=UPI000898F3D3|nr:LLM class oxidoreductase [Tenacibaculum sp. MAR_2009_124]SEB36965.1 luciferase-type oxidoreductase, BA3436 family [Tenacibaculum sp. MAR_2009_124]
MSKLNDIAQQGKLSLGLVFPIEAYSGSIPTMQRQEMLAKKAEELGFKALWFRDIPLHDPNFGDTGQMYDPWVYMTHIMNQTSSIALASGSIILPLRHPVHTAKSMLSIQELSKGRAIFGIASGDRPSEYPAFNKNIHNKGDLFRDNFEYIQSLLKDYPSIESSHYGFMNGSTDLVPKSNHKIPFLVTGHSGQSLDWIAKNSDGWLYYPRDFNILKRSMNDWHQALSENKQSWKPYIQSLYIDLVDNPNISPSPIHLGIRTGSKFLLSYLKSLESFGVNHVLLNLKYSSREANEVIEEIGSSILPNFNS